MLLTPNILTKASPILPLLPSLNQRGELQVYKIFLIPRPSTSTISGVWVNLVINYSSWPQQFNLICNSFSRTWVLGRDSGPHPFCLMWPGLGDPRCQPTATTQWWLCQLRESWYTCNCSKENWCNFQTQRSSLLPSPFDDCSFSLPLYNNLFHTTVLIHAVMGGRQLAHVAASQCCCYVILA